MLSHAYSKNDMAAVDRLLSDENLCYATISDVKSAKYDEDYVLDAEILRIKVAPRGQVKYAQVKSSRQNDSRPLGKPYDRLIVLREVS